MQKPALVWSLLCATASVFGAPGDSMINTTDNRCAVEIVNDSSGNPGFYRYFWRNTNVSGNAQDASTLKEITTANLHDDFFELGSRYIFVTLTTTPPTLSTPTPTNDTQVSDEPDVANGQSIVVYRTMGATPDNQVCSFSYTL